MTQPNYSIVGGDGNTYGPASLDEIKSWIRDGRVTAQTSVSRSDQPGWQAAERFPELGLAAAPGIPALPAGAASSPAAEELTRKVKSGAGWFFWIAGLSLINSIATLSGGEWGFVIGLGFTMFIDVLAKSSGAAGMAVGIVLDALVLGMFVLFGVFAGKGRSWAFIAGMAVYALDALIYVLLQQWMCVAFHAFALFCIFAGFKANRELQQTTGGAS